MGYLYLISRKNQGNQKYGHNEHGGTGTRNCIHDLQRRHILGVLHPNDCQQPDQQKSGRGKIQLLCCRQPALHQAADNEKPQYGCRYIQYMPGYCHCRSSLPSSFVKHSFSFPMSGWGHQKSSAARVFCVNAVSGTTSASRFCSSNQVCSAATFP